MKSTYKIVFCPIFSSQHSLFTDSVHIFFCSR